MINQLCQCGTEEIAMRFWVRWECDESRTLEMRFFRTCSVCSDPEPQYCEFAVDDIESYEMGVEPFVFDPEGCPFSDAEELSYNYALHNNFDLLSYELQQEFYRNRLP